MNESEQRNQIVKHLEGELKFSSNLIKNFIENSKLDYSKLSENAIKSFESKFSSPIYVEKLNALYSQLKKNHN